MKAGTDPRNDTKTPTTLETEVGQEPYGIYLEPASDLLFWSPNMVFSNQNRGHVWALGTCVHESLVPRSVSPVFAGATPLLRRIKRAVRCCSCGANPNPTRQSGPV